MSSKKMKGKQKKDYRRNPPVQPSLLPKDDVDSLSTILNLEIGNLSFSLPDKISSKFQNQAISIESNPTQLFSINFDSLTCKRNWITVSKVIGVFLGSYPKDSGIMTIRLRDSAYTVLEDQVEFEAKGRSGSMWGFASAMSHCKNLEDIDQLFMEVIIDNSKVENTIIGELFLLWEYEETNIPLTKVEPGIITFSFKNLDGLTDLKSMVYQTQDIFTKIASKKKGLAKHLTKFLNTNTVDVYDANKISLQGDLSGDVASLTIEGQPSTSSDHTYSDDVMKRIMDFAKLQSNNKRSTIRELK